MSETSFSSEKLRPEPVSKVYDVYDGHELPLLFEVGQETGCHVSVVLYSGDKEEGIDVNIPSNILNGQPDGRDRNLHLDTQKFLVSIATEKPGAMTNFLESYFSKKSEETNSEIK